MTTSIQPTALGTAPSVPNDLLGVVAYQLERDLTAGPEPQPLQDVRHPLDLAPVASAGRVRWRHAPSLVAHPAATRIAEALDDARIRVAAARATWPSTPVAIVEQCAVLEQSRAELRAAADLLVRAEAMASGEGLTLVVSVMPDPSPASDGPAALRIQTSVYLRP